MGNLSALPKNRTWKLVFTAVENTAVEANADNEPVDVKVSYCGDISSLTVEIPEISIEKEICITFPQGLSMAAPKIEERCYKVLNKAQIEYDVKADILDTVKGLEKMPLLPFPVWISIRHCLENSARFLWPETIPTAQLQICHFIRAGMETFLHTGSI